MKSLGFNFWAGEAFSYSTDCGYSIAPPEIKARDIMTAFTNPDIKAVWCSIGGSTCMQVLPLLDYDEIARHPKPLIGMSDATALLIPITQRCNFPTFYGPTIRYFAENKDAVSFNLLLAAINSQLKRFVNPDNSEIKCLIRGECEGQIIGGNLSLITSLIGTEYFGEFGNKILFIEDISESVYRLERMMRQLLYAGIIDEVNGVIIGDFLNCKNRYNQDYDYMSMFTEFFIKYDKPVLYNVHCGHCNPTATIPFGKNCKMISDGENSSLTIF